MENKGLLALGLGLALAWVLSHPTAAAEEFACPYDDGLVFNTLAELQEHVALDHPGKRKPVTIRWQGG